MSEEPQQNLYDLIFAKLELNEIFGQLTATTLLLQSLIATLKEAGVLNDDQIKAALSKASADVASTFNLSMEQHPQRTEDFTKMRDFGEQILTKARRYLIDDDSSQSEG